MCNSQVNKIIVKRNTNSKRDIIFLRKESQLNSFKQKQQFQQPQQLLTSCLMPSIQMCIHITQRKAKNIAKLDDWGRRLCSHSGMQLRAEA